MKKILLIAFILGNVILLRAGDTLMVRQIYNFEVGDTFDYEYIRQLSMPAPPGQWTPIITVLERDCYRTVIKQKFFSADSSILYYCYYKLPDISHYDTLIYTSLDSSIITYDTIIPPSENRVAYYIYPLGGNPTTENYSKVTTDARIYQNSYKRGLGKTSSEAADLGYNTLEKGGYDISTHLVYYAKDSVHQGTPCSVILGFENTPDVDHIRLWPNPVADILHLSMTNAGRADYQFTITDLLGKEVYIKNIRENETNMDIMALSQGAYIWHLLSGHESIGFGKLIKQ